MTILDSKGKTLAVGDYIRLTVTKTEPKETGKYVKGGDGQPYPEWEDVVTETVYIGRMLQDVVFDGKGAAVPGKIVAHYEARLGGAATGAIVDANTVQLVFKADGSPA